MKRVDAHSNRGSQVNSIVSKHRKTDVPSASKTVILMGAGGAQHTDVNRWKQIWSCKAHFALSRS